MRRIVFDCDRCGKKDIVNMFGLYSRGGETEEDRLDAAQRAELTAAVGHTDEHVVHISFNILEDLEELKSWQHYCKGCFQKVTDSTKSILHPPRKPGKKKKPAAKEAPVAKVSQAEPGKGSSSAVTGGKARSKKGPAGGGSSLPLKK